ncbi:MAG: lysozyme inhibitor LprI family protein [Cyanobacteria bacterium P01_G01_bin.54]
MSPSLLRTLALSSFTVLALLLPLRAVPMMADDDALLVDCENPQTQMVMNICAQQDWDASDRRLKQTYQTLQTELPTEAARSLTTAQQQWLAFRDAECELESSYAEGGSLQPLLYSACAATLTDQRNQDLTDYQQGRLPYGYGTDRDFEMVDRVLNQVYQALQDSISDHRQAELVAAELAWIEYQDAVCAFEQDFATRTDASNDGAGQCPVRLTEQRIGQLIDYLAQYY